MTWLAGMQRRGRRQLAVTPARLSGEPRGVTVAAVTEPPCTTETRRRQNVLFTPYFVAELVLIARKGAAPAAGPFTSPLGMRAERRRHARPARITCRPAELDAAHFTAANDRFTVGGFVRMRQTMAEIPATANDILFSHSEQINLQILPVQPCISGFYCARFAMADLSGAMRSGADGLLVFGGQSGTERSLFVGRGVQRGGRTGRSEPPPPLTPD